MADVVPSTRGYLNAPEGSDGSTAQWIGELLLLLLLRRHVCFVEEFCLLRPFSAPKPKLPLLFTLVWARAHCWRVFAPQ